MSKSIDVTFFTAFSELNDTKPPVPASEFWPQWFKDNPTTRSGFEGRDARTVRSCPGTLDVINAGYIIPLWADYKVVKQEDGQLHWRLPSVRSLGGSSQYGAAIHPHDQIDGYPFKEDTFKGSFKFQNPWELKTPKGYSCMAVQPFYHSHPNLEVLPGCIDTDFYHELHINTFFTSKTNEEIIFPYGMPLVQIIPFKREEYKMQHLAGDHRTKANILTQFVHNSIFQPQHYREKLNVKRYK